MLGILRRAFSFTSWEQSHPKEPPPGDMLDASFDAQSNKIAELESLIDDVRRSDGSLQNGVVGIDQLHPDLRAALRIPATQSPNGDELGWKSAEATADVWAHASADWAEHMPDTIPDGSVAVMDITGDHWSSRWWANQASRVVSGMGHNSVYIGRVPPLEPYLSQLWWNSTTGNLYVLYDDGSSAQWVQINTASNVGDLQAALDLKANIAGQIFTGKVKVPAAGVGGAGFNLPTGSPTGPVDGDVWQSGSAIQYRVGAATFIVMTRSASETITGTKSFTLLQKFLSGTATTAGGVAGLSFGTAGPTISFGSGVPTLTAAQGSLYLRTDGSTNITRMYVNTTGAAVWTPVNTVA